MNEKVFSSTGYMPAGDIRKQEPASLDEVERLMREIGIPEAFALRVRDRALAGIQGQQEEECGDGADILARQLTEAVQSRQDGAWKRIPEEIWIDTMKCYPRFIAEYRRSYGRDGFDRGEWTVRQAGCRLFRIGELEYELKSGNGARTVGLHIPSDVHLEPERLNDSIRKAHAFLGKYWPGWQNLPMTCESWLLSPKLKEMLPEGSRIRRFQDAFVLTGEDPEDTAALEWVFHVAEGQRAGLDVAGLPEETSLQRKMKAMLLAGGKPGNACGILARAFR